jgi:hypothetical protein
VTVHPDLWLPAEEAYTREPPPARTAEAVADEQAFTDIHGDQLRHRAYRNVVTVRAPEEYL